MNEENNRLGNITRRMGAIIGYCFGGLILALYLATPVKVSAWETTTGPYSLGCWENHYVNTNEFNSGDTCARARISYNTIGDALDAYVLGEYVGTNTYMCRYSQTNNRFEIFKSGSQVAGSPVTTSCSNTIEIKAEKSGGSMFIKCYCNDELKFTYEDTSPATWSGGGGINACTANANTLVISNEGCSATPTDTPTPTPTPTDTPTPTPTSVQHVIVDNLTPAPTLFPVPSITLPNDTFLHEQCVPQATTFAYHTLTPGFPCYNTTYGETCSYKVDNYENAPFDLIPANVNISNIRVFGTVENNTNDTKYGVIIEENLAGTSDYIANYSKDNAGIEYAIYMNKANGYLTNSFSKTVEGDVSRNDILASDGTFIVNPDIYIHSKSLADEWNLVVYDKLSVCLQWTDNNPENTIRSPTDTGGYLVTKSARQKFIETLETCDSKDILCNMRNWGKLVLYDLFVPPDMEGIKKHLANLVSDSEIKAPLAYVIGPLSYLQTKSLDTDPGGANFDINFGVLSDAVFTGQVWHLNLQPDSTTQTWIDTNFTPLMSYFVDFCFIILWIDIAINLFGLNGLIGGKK